MSALAPTVHLNGTAGEDLAEGYDRASRSVRDALDALEDAAPNARDYYLTGNFDAARAQHVARVSKLRDVLAELTEIRESIADQVDARDAARRR